MSVRAPAPRPGGSGLKKPGASSQNGTATGTRDGVQAVVKLETEVVTQCAYCFAVIPDLEKAKKINNIAGAEFFENRLENCGTRLTSVFRKKSTGMEIYICDDHVDDRWFGPPESSFLNTKKIMKREGIPLRGFKKPIKRFYPAEVSADSLLASCSLCGRVGVPFVIPENSASAMAMEQMLNIQVPDEGLFLCRVHLPAAIFGKEEPLGRKGDMPGGSALTSKTSLFKVAVNCVYCEHCKNVCRPGDSIEVRRATDLPRTAGQELVLRLSSGRMTHAPMRICRKHYAPGVLQEACSLCGATYAPEYHMYNHISLLGVSKFLGVTLTPRVRLCPKHVPENCVRVLRGELYIYCAFCEYCNELVTPSECVAGYFLKGLERPLPSGFKDKLLEMRASDIRVCKRHYVPETIETDSLATVKKEELDEICNAIKDEPCTSSTSSTADQPLEPLERIYDDDNLPVPIPTPSQVVRKIRKRTVKQLVTTTTVAEATVKAEQRTTPEPETAAQSEPVIKSEPRTTPEPETPLSSVIKNEPMDDIEEQSGSQETHSNTQALVMCKDDEDDPFATPNSGPSRQEPDTVAKPVVKEELEDQGYEG